MSKKPRRNDCGCCGPTWYDWMILGLGWALVAMWVLNRIQTGCSPWLL